jgi:hypothetical protein
MEERGGCPNMRPANVIGLLLPVIDGDRGPRRPGVPTGGVSGQVKKRIRAGEEK